MYDNVTRSLGHFHTQDNQSKSPLQNGVVLEVENEGRALQPRSQSRMYIWRMPLCDIGGSASIVSNVFE